MKTIEFKSNYASFSYRMTAEVGEDLTEATEALCLQGIANLCYRTVGSNVDKALGVKSKKNGGMGRDAVKWDAELGNTIDTAVSAKITELENETGSKLKALKLSFAVTGEHVKGEGGSDAPTKEATEMWTKVQALTESPEEIAAGMQKGAKFERALKALGLAEDYTDETGILACKRKLTEAKAAAKAQASALLGV